METTEPRVREFESNYSAPKVEVVLTYREAVGVMTALKRWQGESVGFFKLNHKKLSDTVLGKVQDALNKF